MILVDAGPLKAMVDTDDQYHRECLATARGIETLGTVWPALAEAMYLLMGFPRAQEAIWNMIVRGSLQLLVLDSGDLPRIRELMQKYADRPMDLADAALLRVAERDNIQTIFTVDRKDFSIYRLHGRVRMKIVP